MGEASEFTPRPNQLAEIRLAGKCQYNVRVDDFHLMLRCRSGPRM